MERNPATNSFRRWERDLPHGKLEYKFIVDGVWKHDGNKPTTRDDRGNINNILEDDN